MSIWPQIHNEACRRQHIGENFFVHHSFSFKKTMSLFLQWVLHAKDTLQKTR